MDSNQKKSVAFIPCYGGNPYQDLLRAGVEDHGCEVEMYPTGLKQLLTLAFRSGVDVVHFHWPDQFVFGKSYAGTVARSFFTYCLFWIIKLRGIGVVWTVHNLHNHENRFASIERRFLKAFISNIAAQVIVHCDAAMEMVVKEFGESIRQKISVIEHGHYALVGEKTLAKNKAREKLGWSSTGLVFVFVGNVRLYKGILELVESFEKVESTSSTLLIAGKVQDLNEQKVLEKRIQEMGAKRISFEPGYLSDERLSLFLAAANVFVAPFRDVLTSGSVILAMSNGLPVIAPRLGCLPEALSQQKDFTYCPNEKNGLTDAIKFAIDNPNLANEFGEKNLAFCRERLCWDRVGMLTSNVYEKAMGLKANE